MHNIIIALLIVAFPFPLFAQDFYKGLSAAQTGDLDVSTGVDLATLNFTGKQVTPVAAGAQNNSLTITSANTKLKDLVISSGSYLKTLTVTATKNTGVISICYIYFLLGRLPGFMKGI